MVYVVGNVCNMDRFAKTVIEHLITSPVVQVQYWSISKLFREILCHQARYGIGLA